MQENTDMGKLQKEMKTITLELATWQELTDLKLKLRAKNLDEVVVKLIKSFKNKNYVGGKK